MLKTADIFQSGMILQRQKPLVIWGKGDPGKTVVVSLGETVENTEVADTGDWKVELPPMPASESETLVITSGDEHITLSDIAIGEVWVAGGQSNMEFHMRYEKHIQEVRPECTNSRLRFFDVPEIAYDGQDKDFDYSKVGIWRKAAPEDIDYFSAVGYYFQKEILEELDVPVGIIGCNWGGTPSFVWMKPESVKKTGNPWVEDYERKARGLDMDSFLKDQKNNPANARGDLFADPFNEFLMPGTPSMVDLAAFIKETGLEISLPDPNALAPQCIPGILYEKMVKPLAPFGIRGFLWYQGESDDDLDCQWLYEDMFASLISDWRELWEDQSLPFLFVQLPGFNSWLHVTAKDYPTLRKCQEEVAKKVPNTWLCSISDGGEEMDIHPKNKKVVGERLALLALSHVYGKELLCDAPCLREVKREGSKVTLTFKNATGGLKVEGDHVEALAVTTGDQEVPFSAEVSGESLILTLAEDSPEKVIIAFARTAWYCVNLYNQSGIPAIPFEVECQTLL